MKKFLGFFRLHLDVPSIIILLLIGLLLYQPFAGYIKLQASNAANLTGTKEVLKDFGINILSDIIAAGIIAIIIIGVFKIKYKASLSGTFTAYDIKPAKTNSEGVVIQSEERTEWGTVKLTHNLFSNDLRGRMTDKAGKIEIEITAKFERGEYLRGFYIEANTKTRRRTGAFLLMLDGNGSNFKGKYVFVDPDKDNYVPQFGEAEWQKI